MKYFGLEIDMQSYFKIPDVLTELQESDFWRPNKIEIWGKNPPKISGGPQPAGVWKVY